MNFAEKVTESRGRTADPQQDWSEQKSFGDQLQSCGWACGRHYGERRSISR